jgi:D-alanyl-D-alanine carboxypeptidase (penicillin-binding protein 5/6)
MRAPRRPRAALPAALVPGLCAVLVVLAPGAPAAADSHEAGAQSSPVGGPLMGARGTVVSPGAPAFPTGITAKGWLVADLDTGDVLAAHDAHGAFAPASTLKTLTAVTLIPRVPATQRIVPTFEDVNVDGSKVGLVDRVAYPAKELFEALLMVSGNDAANALATAAGGHDVTAGLMNEEARRLGALDTHAVNASGLDADGQLSSPYDLALIARQGMSMPDFRTYVATRKSSVSGPGGARIEIYTKNKLIRNYDGALGIKNGYTSRARASFVGAAERNGKRLVVTLMKADPRVWAEAASLLDWGFAASAAGVAPVGELVDPPAPEQAPAAAGADRARATLASAKSGPTDDTRSSLPVPLAGAGALALTGFVARRRQVRRRRSRRYRLDLPL